MSSIIIYPPFLTNQSKIQESIFVTDDLGRNTVVNLENPEYVFLDLKKYKIEEKVYDWQSKEKITIEKLKDPVLLFLITAKSSFKNLLLFDTFLA